MGGDEGDCGGDVGGVEGFADVGDAEGFADVGDDEGDADVGDGDVAGADDGRAEDGTWAGR